MSAKFPRGWGKDRAGFGRQSMAHHSLIGSLARKSM